MHNAIDGPAADNAGAAVPWVELDISSADACFCFAGAAATAGRFGICILLHSVVTSSWLDMI
eukprot:254153-Karenia_brevis.AAC.1